MISASVKYFVTLVMVVLAVGASLMLYARYVDRPWTRDGQIRANIVGIAPRVAGPIVQIPIHDNEPVKKGDLLFEIDPATYQAALDQAQAQLKQAQAKQVQAQEEYSRQVVLYQTKVTDIQDLQNSQDALAGAEADTAAAQAAVESAQLNLNYTRVVAPVDGYLTNMNTSLGQYVNAGQQLLALVDSSSFWVAAYFKETQLRHVQPGGKVKITMIGHDNQPFDGSIVSVAWGIFLQDGSTVELLPQVNQTIDWVRLPNRFPVRVNPTSASPVPLRIGQTVSVSVVEEP